MQGEDFIQAWKTRCFPHQHIWIFTSDDGWKDTATELAPIAREYRVPFFFGIIAPKVGTPGFISQDELTSLSADPLFTIASHSLTHREMHRISVADEHKEICNSKAELEAMIHTPIDTFVYPVGKIGKKSVEYLKECGYTLAWSTGFGKMLDWNHLEPYILNRVRIHHDTGPKMFLHRAPK